MAETSVSIQYFRSAQAAGRGARRKRYSASSAAGGESVVRVVLRRSAQAAGSGARRKRNSASSAAGGESVVRVFLRSTRLSMGSVDLLLNREFDTGRRQGERHQLPF